MVSKLSKKHISNIELYLFQVANSVTSAGYGNVDFDTCGPEPVNRQKTAYHTHIIIPESQKNHPLQISENGVGFIDISLRKSGYRVTKQFHIGTIDAILDKYDATFDDDEKNNMQSVRQAFSLAIKQQFNTVEDLCKAFTDGKRFLAIDSRIASRYHDTRDSYPNVIHCFDEAPEVDPDMFMTSKYTSSIINLKPQIVRSLSEIKLEEDIMKIQQYFRNLKPDQKNSQ